MTDYRSARAKRLTPYVAGEQPSDAGIIKLNTNENPYPPAPGVRAAIEAAAESLPLYPPTDGGPLRAAIAALHGVSTEWVFTSNGSDEALALSFLAFFGADRPVCAPELTYSFYPVYANLFDVPYAACPMGPDFSVDPDALLAGGAVVLANPNAPTTLALPTSTIAYLADTLHKRGELLLVDEAYADFSTESAVGLLQDNNNLLIIRTLSKSYSLAGLRVGYALGQPELIRALTAVKDSFNSYPLDQLAIAGGKAAIEDQPYHQNNLASIIKTRDLFTRGLREMGFILPDSHTNFVFARHPAHSGEHLFRDLRARNILVRRFDRDPIRDHLRITIGTPAQMGVVVEALGGLV